MHQVLQRTRPTPPPPSKPSSKLRSLLRSFLAGKRALVMLAVIGGAALSSQALLTLLRQGPDRAPERPEGAGGTQQSASTAEPSVARPAKPAAGSPAATPVQPGGSSAAANSRGRADLASAPRSASSAPLPTSASSQAPGTVLAASSGGQATTGWGRPSRSRPGGATSEPIITDTGSDSRLRSPQAAAVSAAPPRQPEEAISGRSRGVRQLGSVTLADLDPSLGVPCSDTTAALPSDTPSEEAWLPGSDAASAPPSAALDPIPLPPIYSETPDQADRLSSHSLQANRPSSCLLNQPSGRN